MALARAMASSAADGMAALLVAGGLEHRRLGGLEAAWQQMPIKVEVVAKNESCCG